MKDATIYNVDRTRDHLDRLYDIINLATVGAASTETNLNIAHLDDAQRCLFELIYRLASEAVDIAETAQETHRSKDAA